MLKLVLGRSGSGKTTTLRELVRQSLREDRERPVFLIVPEQASFENERAMLSLLGAEDAQLVHVLSFSRLADEAFRQAVGESFIELAQTEEGQEIFGVFSQVGYDWGSDSDYDGERAAQALLKSMEA